MTTQTEAQRLADDIHSAVPTYKLCQEAADELRRLAQVETAWREWLDKTEWVQTSSNAGELGMHRADVLRQRIENLEAENLRLASEVANRNRRALEGDEHKAAFDRLYDKFENLEAENARMRSELERPMSSEATVLVHDNARLRAELEALRGSVPAAVEATADNDAAYGYQDGWNACRKAMLAAAPQPATQPTELVKGWWAHTCPEDGVIDVVPYQLTPADKRAGWVEYEIYTKPAAQQTEPAGKPVAKETDGKIGGAE
jgi:hypothetical protein